MITLKTDKKRLALFIALVCAASWAEADEAIEFNTDVLDASDRHNVDLQRFSEGNFVAPGEYLLDVRINSQEIPQQSIRYIADPANSHKSMACLTPQQLELLALKEEALTHIHPLTQPAMTFPACRVWRCIIAQAYWTLPCLRHG